MKKRELAPDVKTPPYFEKALPPTPPEEGSREMGPLYPFLISGGTNTERYYFIHITDITDYKFNIIPRYFSDESKYNELFPQRIKEILGSNAEAKIYCVFDWDTVYGDKSKYKKLEEKHNNFIKQFKHEISSGVVTLCPSMPCFEYWLLLHFEEYTGLLKNYSKVANRLAPHIKTYFHSSGKKLKKLLKSEKHLRDSSWVQKLCADNKLELAIERAKKSIKDSEGAHDLNKRSFTFVYKLFR